MKGFLVFLILIPLFVRAQEHPLDIFKPLTENTWEAEGNWGDGSIFKQSITFSFNLGGELVIVKSDGFTDTQQTQYGPRNHGVRQYDSTLQKIRFWEFDVFGQVTQGTVVGVDRDLIYRYDYGGTLVTERWSYVDDQTYDFTVGVYGDGKWQQKFLETQFKAETSKD